MVSWMQYNNKTRLTAKHALQLAAPHTWTASVCPSLFGICFCRLRGFPLGPGKAWLVLLACIFLQSAVNTLNDYVDFVKGTDSAEDNVEVSDAVLIYSGIRPKAARNLGIGYLLAGLFFGLLASLGNGPAPILIGAVGGAVVLLYSGGPLPVSSLPVGELVSGFVMGGLIPLGTAACADGRLHWDILFYSLPLICGIALIMMSNNGCDIEKDILAGRRTLPTVLGREKTLALYRSLVVLWILLLVLMAFLLAGQFGFVCPVLLILFGGRHFRRILGLGLLPEQRILQMKGIAAANLFGNGALILTLLVKMIAEVSRV